LLWRLSSHKKCFASALGFPTSWGVWPQHLILSRCQKRNFTNGFLLEFDFFLAIVQTPTTVCLIYTPEHICSNLMPLRFEHLLQ